MNDIDESYIRKGYVFAKSAIENNDIENLKEELDNCPETINYWR